VAERVVPHPSIEDRRARGKQARNLTPPSAHAGWEPVTDRPDPVRLLEEQNLTREPDLVPVRHGRMMVSPFTFYRGAAKIMAADLAGTPTAGLTVQLCGDAHLSNFGLFASPERVLLFDVNDFDETLPGPFEYDVKRLAASFAVGARNNGFSKADTRAVTVASVTAYREAMHEFAAMRTMDIWYARMSSDDLLESVREASGKIGGAGRSSKADTKGKAGRNGKVDGKKTKESGKENRSVAVTRKVLDKARTHDSLQALSKLGEVVDGRSRIVSQPPIIVPARDLAATYGMSGEEVQRAISIQHRGHRATLEDYRRHLLERFEIVDVARKVVGVGSVGTRAFIVLLQGRDQSDPLFLQVKEATASVLEAHLPRSRYRQHGARVVHGQRIMQAASDIYLGWTRGADVNRHYYWRQLRDMKGSADPETMKPLGFTWYAQACGWTLARAHARSGDPVAIAAYLGHSDRFDKAITDFSERYADRNEQDYAEFVKEIRSGRLEALEGL
jgi:uncharacterized protein (DUF2252 family)